MKWATRAGVHIDRAACAWLIRRVVDPQAEFVFLTDPADLPAEATGFDMRGVELSHHRVDGAVDCTFETIPRRAAGRAAVTRARDEMAATGADHRRVPHLPTVVAACVQPTAVIWFLIGVRQVRNLRRSARTADPAWRTGSRGRSGRCYATSADDYGRYAATHKRLIPFVW